MPPQQVPNKRSNSKRPNTSAKSSANAEASCYTKLRSGKFMRLNITAAKQLLKPLR